MKERTKLASILIAAGLSATMTSACTSQSQPVPTDQDVSRALVNDVVLPSYKELVEGTERLNQALQALVENPIPINLKTARDVWKQSRDTWETTETWAYGPAETENFDPNLDDWPVSDKELAEALSEKNFTQENFDALDTTGKGFHGIEYVIFGDGDTSIEASDLTTQQLAYLRIAGKNLESNAKELLAAWSGPGGFGKADVEAYPAKTVNDILEGMAGCLDEVGNTKLGEALASGKGELESTFSGNTGADVLSNLQGVQLAWKKSKMQDYAKAKDPELSNQLTAELKAALAQAKELPTRLNDKLDDGATQKQVQKLMKAISQAFNTTEALKAKIG